MALFNPKPVLLSEIGMRKFYESFALYSFVMSSAKAKLLIWTLLEVSTCY
jgi:hypothetical protein